MRIGLFFVLALALATAPFTTHSAKADENPLIKPTDVAPPSTSTGDINKANPTASAIDESQNNRMKTLEGSKSPYSLQFNLTYSGSSINHPFASTAPNPGNAVPPPLVSLSGTFSGRYRFDSSTTAGIGAGITSYQVFQGPKDTSVANPYADIAHSYKIGVIKNRADFQVTGFTDHQTNTELGQRIGFTAVNEAFYEFPFGLTAGLVFEVDYTVFSGDAKYHPSMTDLENGAVIGTEQTQWDWVIDPYFEYSLNDTFNLRTVIGIQSLNDRDMQSDFSFYHPKIYETLGLGIQVAKPVFLYTFVQGFWYNLGTDTVLLGVNAIINIF